MAQTQFRHLVVGIVSTAAMAAALTVGGSSAKATPNVDVSINGGAFSALTPITTSGNQITFTGTTLGGLDFTSLTFSSNSPGTPTKADAVSSDLEVTYSGAPAKVVFAFTSTNFTAPVAPPTVSLGSNVGGSVFGSSAGNALSFTSCIYANNSVEDTCSGATYVTSTVSPNTTIDGNFSAGSTAPITSLVGPYSIVEILSVSLGASGDINFAGSSTVTPVPEPLTLSVIGTALVGVGVARSRRRRG